LRNALPSFRIRDSGKTWRAQHQGGARAALLALYSEAGRVPHELLVQQAGNEGYLTAVQILTTRDDTER
jgi:hypothetical protein